MLILKSQEWVFCLCCFQVMHEQNFTTHLQRASYPINHIKLWYFWYETKSQLSNYVIFI